MSGFCFGEPVQLRYCCTVVLRVRTFNWLPVRTLISYFQYQTVLPEKRNAFFFYSPVVVSPVEECRRALAGTVRRESASPKLNESNSLFFG